MPSLMENFPRLQVRACTEIPSICSNVSETRPWSSSRVNKHGPPPTLPSVLPIQTNICHPNLNPNHCIYSKVSYTELYGIPDGSELQVSWLARHASPPSFPRTRKSTKT